MRKTKDWSEYNMDLAAMAATRSKDPKTQVGAYIVTKDNKPVSFGYNGLPAGMPETDAIWDRESKRDFVIHAEVNALLNAQSNGVDFSECTLYTTLFPCNRCATLIAQLKLKEVCYLDFRSDTEYLLAWEILESCGVKYRRLEKKSECDHRLG